jgi:hypothetical protein
LRLYVVRWEILDKLIKEEFYKAIADHRLSPDEEAHLSRVTENLGLDVSYDGATQALTGADSTPAGESCSWSSPATHHELP